MKYLVKLLNQVEPNLKHVFVKILLVLFIISINDFEQLFCECVPYIYVCMKIFGEQFVHNF